MKQETLEALLGRSLSATEATNRELYLKIARQRMEEMLCTPLCYESEVRHFEVRDGYRTVFTDIFKEVSSVMLNGELVTGYKPMQFDRYNGTWYNSIVFDETTTGTISVNADWGFSELPSDLKLLQAALFDNITKQNSLDRTVNSKKNEDFSISYNHSSITMADTLMDSLLKDHRQTIEKYRMCQNGGLRHGEISADRL